MRLSGDPETALARKGDLQRAVHHPKVIAWYENATLAEQAVDLAIEIGLAHAFVDGNKRISTYAMRVFLRLNDIRIPDNGPFMEFTDAFVAAIGTSPNERKASVEGLVAMVQRWIDTATAS